ncbi:17418_t:CDS:1, partial [Dentiscutata erythropus]
MDGEILNNVKFSEYWKKPHEQWNFDTYRLFYLEKHPGASKQTIHSNFAIELKILNENLNQGRRKN